MKHSITCKQAVDYLSRKEEGKLSLSQRIALWRHLVNCSLCRIFAVQNRHIVKSAKNLKPENFSISQIEKEKLVEHVLNNDHT